LKLRRKTIIAIAAVIVSLLVVISSVAYAVLMARFSQLERQDAEQNVTRVLNALSDEISDLDTFVNDYASWDDTYNFIETNYSAYIDSNLMDETFRHSDLNCMLFINASGYVVYARAFDVINDVAVPVSESLLQMVSTSDSLWRHSSTTGVVEGIVMLPENPMLISSRPILTSVAEGPIRGALMMGRYLDQERLDSLSLKTHLQIDIQEFDDPQLPSDFQTASETLNSATVFVQPLNTDIVGGYSTVSDVFGVPALILRVDLPRDIYKQGQESLVYLVVSLFSVGVIFGAVSLLLLEKFVLAPLMQLDNDVKSISQRPNISKRLKVKGDDELASLGVSVNGMLSALEQSQRLATIGELTTMVAHDLRNPLQGIQNAVYYLKTKFGSTPDNKTSKMLNLIQRDIEYSDKIVRDLLDYSADIPLASSETTLQLIVKEALETVEVPQNILVVNSVADEFKIRVDRDRMKRAFVNIIKNAFDAMPSGGHLTVVGRQENGILEIAFSDTGRGIPAEVLEKVGKPLFTTKAKGMGLGFAICKRIVEAHGGKISIESTVEKGTTVKLKLPIKSTLEERGEKEWLKMPESSLSTMRKA